MRVVVPLIALLLTTGATEPEAPAPDRSNTNVPKVAIEPTTGKAVCRDTIRQVREERGLPWVDRGTAADPDEPLLIAAVDKRIGGCSVMVMRNDTSDVRPLPEPRRHRMMPAQ